MAEYPNPEQNYDPAGSTQMFRAFVDEAASAPSGRRQAAAPAPEPAGSRTGLIVGIVVALVVVAVAAYIALG